MDVTVVVATFGDTGWMGLADEYALPSAYSINVPVVRVHGGDNLAESRNAGAALVKTEWICFLDADDCLSRTYFEDMESATGDLRVPRLMFPAAPGWIEPFDLSLRNMDVSNQCPIGTLIRKSMFDEVGGFWNEPVYEDWSLFRRAWLLGASIEHTRAKYYAYNLGGRNSSTTDPVGEVEKIRSSHDEWLMNR